MDADCRPERMTAIVGHELARYNIAVAALSETRRADTSCVKEMGAGYTFFWSGKTETEPRVSGVGFAIRSLKPHLSSQRDLRPHNDTASAPGEQNTPDPHQCLCSNYDPPG